MRKIAVKITKDDVYQAIQTLIAEKRKITNREIRDVLGRGSFSTILAFRKELGYGSEIIKQKQPENIQPRRKLGMNEMMELMQEKLAAMGKQLAAQQEEIASLKKA
jgi:hypothetical protein